MRFFQLVLLYLCVVVTTSAQNTVGTITVSNEVFEGYTLFTIHKKVFLINNCGEIINEWTSDYLPGNSVYLLPNGNILRAGAFENGSDISFGGMGGIVELFDWEGNVIWTFEYSSDQFRQHHDVYPMPNGNVLILAATKVTFEEAVQAGRHPFSLADNLLYNEQIIEIEPVGSNQGNVVWEWNVMDHLIQDSDPTKDNFGVVADNPRKLDINFLNGFDSGKNWLHINSIQYDQLRDQIVISSRRLSELWIIDHSTTTTEAAGSTGGLYGHGGDFLYRWGNPQAYDAGSAIDRRLYGQHMPYIVPNGLPNAGKIMVFNNGFGRTPAYSEVNTINPLVTSPGFYEYSANTAFGPTDPEFRYPETAPTVNSDFYSAIVSSAQQLPNGNILICEGREGRFFEIDNSNTLVWEYISPIDLNGAITAQFETPPTTKTIFRALKYSVDYPAFANRDLTPSGTIETSPNTAFCEQILNFDSYENSIVSVYPNPTNGMVSVLTKDKPVNSITVYNTLGEKIIEIKNANTINLERLQKGVYFLKITMGNAQQVKKVLKQ